MFQSYRKENKRDWGTESEGSLTQEQIRTGSLLRIADGVEAMAKNHVQLQKELDRFRKLYNRELERSEALQRSNKALRGHITRLKRRLTT